MARYFSETTQGKKQKGGQQAKLSQMFCKIGKGK